MAIDFRKMFEDEMANSGSGYDQQIADYRAAQAQGEKDLTTQRDTQIKKLADQQSQTKQDAYVARRLAEKNMTQFLAAQGINGGMAETTASNIYNDQLKAQNKANSAFSAASTEVGNAYSSNLASLKAKWAQAIGDAETKKREDSFQKAQWAYQMAIQEEERQRQEEERAAAAARGSGRVSSKSPTTPKLTDAQKAAAARLAAGNRLAKNNYEVNVKAKTHDPYAWQKR